MTPPGVQQQTSARGGCRWLRHNGVLYLGAGGSDNLAKYDKTARGTRSWVRNTSGSVQVVEVMDGQLVIGGHFWEVADQVGDNCGHRGGGTQKLDPNDECQTRKGIAAYSFSGDSTRTGTRRTRASTALCGRCTWKGLDCTPAGSSSP